MGHSMMPIAKRKQAIMPTRAQWRVEVALGLKLDTRNMKMGLDL